MNSITYAEVMDQMSSFQLVYSRIFDFRVPDDIKSDWMVAADLYVAGNQKEAVRVSLNAVNFTRNLFASFLHGSPKHFETLIKKRVDDDFDEDIIARLRKKHRSLDLAIRCEINGTFEQRIEAYIAMKKDLLHADKEQKIRVEKRDFEAAETIRVVREANAAIRKEKQEAEAKRLEEEAKAVLLEKRLARERQAEAERKIAEEQRQIALQQRKELADKARALFA
jgi:hypothetical protein